MKPILTVRESTVLARVAQGKRNLEIANELTIAVGTVKIHLHNMYEKCHVHTRLQLVNHARSQGWLS